MALRVDAIKFKKNDIFLMYNFVAENEIARPRWYDNKSLLRVWSELQG